MKGKRTKPLYAAGIIERYDNLILIVRPTTDDEALRAAWQFPRGLAAAEESPEAAMRRVARAQLGIDVEIVVGQPPLLATIGDQSVEMRYFFCGVQHGDAHASAYAEIRWIRKGHLREYEFDDASRPVTDWLLDARH